MATLQVRDSGLTFDFYVGDRMKVTIGRNDTCDVTIEDEQASRVHCEITRGEEGFVLADLGSSNGTHVNGRPAKRHALRSGDTIGIGKATLKFDDPNEAVRPPALAPPPGPTPTPVVRWTAPEGEPRPPGRRLGGRRRGPDPLLVGGLGAMVLLIVAIVLVLNVRGAKAREGGEAIARAKALVRDHRDYRGAIEALRRVPSNAPDEVQREARSLREEWSKRIAPASEAVETPAATAAPTPAEPVAAPAPPATDAASRALAEADKSAADLRAANRFGDALALYKSFLDRHAGTPAADEAKSRSADILKLAESEWKRRHARAGDLWRARKFQEAREVYLGVIETFNLPDITRLAQKEIQFVNDVENQ
ncbi:MAG: FHA domain-containing protein [Planctomycetales bacterium]|nr:FHA domain-containing protein [Planctomycetales bacterium]